MLLISGFTASISFFFYFGRKIFPINGVIEEVTDYCRDPYVKFLST